MRRGACFCALLAALAAAGCATSAPQPPPPARESERTPDALPDAYKHPPK
jgi:hypothetical protein